MTYGRDLIWKNGIDFMNIWKNLVEYLMEGSLEFI